MAGRRRREREPDDRDLGPDADPESVARTIILTRLTARARSRKELEDALARRCVPTEVASRVLDRYQQLGLVDDTEFAREWARTRQQNRGLSARAVRYELRDKGVADDDVTDAIEELGPDADRMAARQVVRGKLRGVRSLPPEVARRRLMGVLARKGFGVSLAADVVREALGDTDPAGDPFDGGTAHRGRSPTAFLDGS
jgi:regulatory protein